MGRGNVRPSDCRRRDKRVRPRQAAAGIRVRVSPLRRDINPRRAIGPMRPPRSRPTRPHVKGGLKGHENDVDGGNPSPGWLGGGGCAVAVFRPVPGHSGDVLDSVLPPRGHVQAGSWRYARSCKGKVERGHGEFGRVVGCRKCGVRSSLSGVPVVGGSGWSGNRRQRGNRGRDATNTRNGRYTGRVGRKAEQADAVLGLDFRAWARYAVRRPK